MTGKLLQLKTQKVILASASPRRHALLKGLDIPFETIIPGDIPEEYPGSLRTEEVPVYLARRKAEAGRDLLDKNIILLTADTIVVHGNGIIHKPVDRQDANKILHILSGSMHRVLTGVCLLSVEKEKCFTAETKVWFSELSGDEISYYLETYAPFDKAGAYGIQEWIGYAAIERIEGSFYNVMGLPVHRVYQYLKEF